MGGVWLWDMPDVLRAAGLTVDTYPGWETRSRSSGGYDAVMAVQVHHTASSTTPANDMSYMWNGSPDRPVGAIYLARDGRVTVGAAGATNTSGKGGPMQTSKGTIPLDAANRYVISIEAANAGTGESWPQVQQDAYVKVCNALIKHYGLTPGDVHAHFEWTTRKVDPAGNSKYATGSNKWNMDQFRGDVWLLNPTPTEPSLPPGDDMLHPVKPFRNSDTRFFGGAVSPGNRVFLVNGDIIPANAIAIAMNVSALDADQAGYVTVWPGGSRPDTSCLNYQGDRFAYSAGIVVGLVNRGFSIYNHTKCHLICDITGYWTP